ncbi:MAG: hypothetical protein LH618_00695 [Saprospiraceae bacterium]|nr:hypothetical protein [Saprospiraceae bacterium]
MHWKFDPFFSIDILHGKYSPPTAGQADPPVPAFSVEPTGETRRRLLRMGWVFKPYAGSGGGTLYAEKIVEPDGATILRSKPKQNEGFTFVLRLTEPALVRQTKPFMRSPTGLEIAAEPDPAKKNLPRPNENLPSYSGRARLLYFDNLKIAVGTGPFLLSANNAVEFTEFASRMPTHFMFTATTPGISQLKMDSADPAATSTAFPLPALTKSAEIKLPENGYRLTQQPLAGSETLFLTDETLHPDTLGVVRIFQPVSAEWEPFRRYQIFFDKV